MPEDLVAALGLRVLDAVEEASGRPPPTPRRVTRSDRLRPELAGAQVLHVQRVLAEAGLVGGVGEQVAVRAHRHARPRT